MEISVVGASFRTAPLELREQLSLDGEQTQRVLRSCRAEGLFEEGLALSTCNRTEFLVVTRDGEVPADHILRHLGHVKTLDTFPADIPLYRFDGIEAVRHLMRVASSLDSQVVGEHEILGQLKQAFRWARRAGTVHFLLHKLMHRAFRAGKRVRTETGLGAGLASVSGAAVELARRTLADLSRTRILLIGAGRTAELAAHALVQAGAASLTVANRTVANARALAARLADEYADGGMEEQDSLCPARRHGATSCPLLEEGSTGASGPLFKAAGLDDLPALLEGSDLVICSASAPGRLVAPAMVAERRSGSPVLIVDIAVPRNVDPAVGDLPGVSLRDIDHLDRIVAENAAKREAELPLAEAIVEEEVAKFARWRERLRAVPTIKLLHEHVEGLRRQEMERCGAQLTDAERERLDAFSRALCKKVLHTPVAQLREASEGGESDLETLELARRLFGLDSPGEDG
jgi:glutamyl-tRNA reductase